ncbi:hypothetical protein [Mycolicibacter kumamotonensis]|jgi:hypothetical protein|uniref:Secreted protein n=2 Tax=Mycolicibacter kumamotonensis TaxID=354243 RepID=A0A1X0DR50_9MYCO|nr:hypothetical protein [Mycolicibacter kumamotonensis]NDJ91475.1 hypothetical protein [Mycolicibacter kumamotonensis]ORA74846.1 hypothetical protein BST28_22460 [Mycolicibacter kumamotonensis]
MSSVGKKIISSGAKMFAVLGMFIASSLAGVPGLVHAGPPGTDDPHTPNPEFNYCPGGGSGGPGSYWCDGEPYPDGSFWHMFKQAHTWHAYCVTDKGNPLPPPAPPGGCEGAV